MMQTTNATATVKAPKMTAEQAQSFETFSEINAATVEQACENGCTAYEDVFTFNRWIAQGMVVRKGEKSTKITVWVKGTKTDRETNEKVGYKIAKTVSVFCRCQVKKLDAKR